MTTLKTDCPHCHRFKPLALIFLASAHVCLSQSTVGIPLRRSGESAPAEAPPIYRVVTNQVFNARKSVLWSQVYGKCSFVSSNGVGLMLFKTNRVYKQYYVPPPENVSVGAYTPAGAYGWKKRLVSEDYLPDRLVFLQNYSQCYPAFPASEGKEITVWAMRLGVTDLNGKVLELWDCGIPIK